MASRATEIRTRQAAIRVDLDALEALDEPAEDDHTRSDALLQEWDELGEELKPLADREGRIAAVRAAMQNDDSGREPGFRAPDVVIRNKRDPFADLDSIRSGVVPDGEIRGRALDAVERFAKRSDAWTLPSDAAENATRLVERSGRKFGTEVSRHMLQTGSPEYLANFEQYLRDPAAYGMRAAMSLTPANGGYLVPFTLDPTIIMTNAGSANPYRQIANLKQTASNDWNGVSSAGVTAEWTAEGTEAADASPTVGQLKITPVKADAYLFGSYEVLDDADFAQQLPELLADAKDRLEETAFAVGTGSTQPYGTITRGTAYAPTGSAAGPRIADVYNLQAALPARWRGPGARNVWLAALPTINALRQLAKFTGSTTSMVDDSGDTPTMLGKQLLESTSISSTFANGNKVLAWLDGRQFYIVDRIGMSVAYDPLVLGATRRPTGQGAFYAFWRVGSDVSTATAVRVLQLTT